MVNGIGLTAGSIASLGACGGGSSVEAGTHIDNELAEVGGFRKVTGGGLVRRSWVDRSIDCSHTNVLDSYYSSSSSYHVLHSEGR